MKTPICKLCGKAHWASEEHGGEPSVPEYVKAMAAGALGYEKAIVTFPDPNPPETVTTVTSDVTPVTKSRDEKVLYSEPSSVEDRAVEREDFVHRGRPKKHKDAAARQRAYRERSK